MQHNPFGEQFLMHGYWIKHRLLQLYSFSSSSDSTCQYPQMNIISALKEKIPYEY